MRDRIKKYILLLVIAFIHTKAITQVLIQFNPATDGATINKLMNVTLNNRYPSELMAVVTLTVRESKQGVVLKIQTPQYLLARGVSMLPANVFQRSRFVYSANTIGQQIGQTRSFPDGDYEYCYEINLAPVKGYVPPVDYFESCFSHTIARMVPLQLINPYEKEVSCNKRPNFLWQPALPFLPGTRYTLVLVQILPGQLKSEAIAYNKPIIVQNNIPGSTLQFPANASSLKEGAKYAWQVLATNGKFITTRSEIWEYQVSCEEESTLSDKDSYRELKDSRDEGIYTATVWLRFAFYNPYGNSELDYTITDLTKKGAQIKRLPKLNMLAGFNKYELEMASVSGLIPGNQYLLTVNLPQGKKLFLTFEYKSNADQ
jgi:hypothetical protein